MLVSCSHCAFSTEVDEAMLPVGGMEGICPGCRSSIPLGNWHAAELPVQAVSVAIASRFSGGDGRGSSG